MIFLCRFEPGDEGVDEERFDAKTTVLIETVTRHHHLLTTPNVHVQLSRLR